MAQTRRGVDPQMLPPPGAAQGSAHGARQTGVSFRGPFGEAPVEDLRHPSEPSRFALALVAMAFPIAFALVVMVSLGQELQLIAIILTIVVALILIWVAV